MTKRKQKTMIYKSPPRKLKFEEPEPHKVIGMKTGVPVVSLLSKSKKGRHCDYDKRNLLIKLTRHNTYKCTKETESSNGTAHLKETIAQAS